MLAGASQSCRVPLELLRCTPLHAVAFLSGAQQNAWMGPRRLAEALSRAPVWVLTPPSRPPQWSGDQPHAIATGASALGVGMQEAKTPKSLT